MARQARNSVIRIDFSDDGQNWKNKVSTKWQKMRIVCFSGKRDKDGKAQPYEVLTHARSEFPEAAMIAAMGAGLAGKARNAVNNFAKLLKDNNVDEENYGDFVVSLIDDTFSDVLDGVWFEERETTVGGSIRNLLEAMVRAYRDKYEGDPSDEQKAKWKGLLSENDEQRKKVRNTASIKLHLRAIEEEQAIERAKRAKEKLAETAATEDLGDLFDAMDEETEE